ncbi:MAG: hypothetical protein KDK29_14915 [Sedimentitalea sp.]|nr:hypothetical protein [Sedimentitalea sp.]
MLHCGYLPFRHGFPEGQKMTQDYKMPTPPDIDAILLHARRERARVIAGLFRRLFRRPARPVGSSARPAARPAQPA